MDRYPVPPIAIARLANQTMKNDKTQGPAAQSRLAFDPAVYAPTEVPTV
jgi:hypothetical protein